MIYPDVKIKLKYIFVRTWLDQASFSIAQSFGENLPAPGTEVYQWPADMVKPDIAFFLNLPVMKYGADTPVNEFKKRSVM